MKPETFIILTPGFPKSEADSTCLPSQQLFTKILKQHNPSLNIVVLTFEYPLSTKIYNWHNCQVIPFGGKTKTKISRLILWRKVWNKLSQLNKDNYITGLLSFWCGECALIGHRYGEKNRIKHACWILGQDAKAGNKYVTRIRPKPGELIAMSDFLQEAFFKNHTIRPAYVIPNGIDPDMFGEKQLKREIDILGAGSLIPLKQFDVFLSIIKLLKTFDPAIKAVICGKGTEEHSLLKIIETNGLKGNVKLVGEQPHSELLNIMGRSKVFLHTSNYEGFSTVCLEALYAGCKVISFMKPMKDDIEQWYIVNNKEAMTQKILTLLNDPVPTYSSVLLYSMAESVKKIRDLYYS